MSLLRRTGAALARLLESLLDPAAAAGEYQLYTKDVSGATQLFGRSSSGAVSQFSPVGAADLWTYLVLGADFTTNSAVAVAITGLDFAPLANATYAVEGQIVVSSTVAGVSPQVDILWPGGLAGFGGGMISSTNTVTGNTFANNTQGTTVQSITASVPTNVDGYLALVSATFSTGGAPVGSFSAALESETGGTNVIARAGSWIRYRRMA